LLTLDISKTECEKMTYLNNDSLWRWSILLLLPIIVLLILVLVGVHRADGGGGRGYGGATWIGFSPI
jgi:hypothetical protein